MARRFGTEKQVNSKHMQPENNLADFSNFDRAKPHWLDRHEAEHDAHEDALRKLWQEPERG